MDWLETSTKDIPHWIPACCRVETKHTNMGNTVELRWSDFRLNPKSIKRHQINLVKGDFVLFFTLEFKPKTLKEKTSCFSPAVYFALMVSFVSRTH